jgi:hypothetical protein
MLKLTGTITTLSPLSHNSDESASTETKFRRMPFMVSGQRHDVPVYSGNAFRGILRRIAARQLCDAIGLKPVPKLYYLLFTGGMLEKGSSSKVVDVSARRELRANVPMLSLFGGGCGSFILAGKMRIGALIPRCADVAQYLSATENISYHELTETVFYTRRDDLEDKEERAKDAQAQQMKYEVECIIPGVTLEHTMHVDSDDEIELSCFGAALSELIERGQIGGKGNVGHGRVAMHYHEDIPSGGAYRAWLVERKDTITAFLESLA